MKFWVKIGLFLSAYLPLFLILTIKNWFNWYAFGIFCFACAYSCVWFFLINIVKKETAEPYKIAGMTDKTKETLAYFIPYIISFINFNLDRWQDLLSLLILFVILFAVYMNSDLLFFNPLMSIFGYKIYQVKAEKFQFIGERYLDMTVLTSDKLQIGETIRVWDLSDNVFLGTTKHG